MLLLFFLSCVVCVCVWLWCYQSKNGWIIVCLYWLLLAIWFVGLFWFRILITFFVVFFSHFTISVSIAIKCNFYYYYCCCCYSCSSAPFQPHAFRWISENKIQLLLWLWMCECGLYFKKYFIYSVKFIGFLRANLFAIRFAFKSSRINTIDTVAEEGEMVQSLANWCEYL